MFQNIEELEKQVKEFQKNILASSEFVRVVQNLIDMVKSQQTGFEKDSKEMLSSIESYTNYVKEQNDFFVNSIAEQRTKEIDDYLKSNEEFVENIKSSSERLSLNLENKYNEFVRKLENTNVDELSTEFQKLKKSINSKFILLHMSVVVVIVLMIVLFFIK